MKPLKLTPGVFSLKESQDQIVAWLLPQYQAAMAKYSHELDAKHFADQEAAGGFAVVHAKHVATMDYKCWCPLCCPSKGV
jgi:hypothetical protein